MRNLYISILALFSFLQIVSCTKENDDVTKVSETKEVPVSFSFQTVGGLTTKAGETAPAYHYAREVAVDRVKLYVYKRASDAVYINDEEGFSLDEGKGRVLTAVEQNGHDDNTTGQPHFVAQGTLQLESGYDYRITALGYSEEKGESKLFKLNNGFFRTAEVELTDTEYKTPELFWGNVVTINNDSIFSYETATDPDMELSGCLYRVVAGVELTLSNVPENVQSIELMADSINIKSQARYYDDFLETYEMKKNTNHTHYLLGKWDRGDMPGVQCKIIGPNLFDICTSLSLRIKLKNEDDESYQYARLRIKEKGASTDDNVSGQSLGTKAIPNDGGNGTGIIPGGEETPEDPENPDDPDKNPFTICFKRNNYYQIEGDYKKLMTNELNITVIVNPNWDADVSLTLGEAQ